jgi:hypothetical protein
MRYPDEDGRYGPGGQAVPPSVPPRQYPPEMLPPEAPVPASDAIRPEDPAAPATASTEDPRLGLEVGRYWAGALATVIVCALIGLVAAFLLTDVFDLELQPPPDMFGSGSTIVAWTVVGGLFALVAAIVLHLLVMSTPRPRTFFGWIVGLATVIFAALPFAGDFEVVPATLSALVWIVIGIATWSLLTGVLGRTLVRRQV